MKQKNLLLWLILSISTQFCYAQNIIKTNKISLEGDRADYRVFSLADNGVLLARYPDILGTGYEVNYTRYDQNLKLHKTFKLKLGKKETVGFTKYFGDKYFYFVVGEDLNKSRSRGYGASFKNFTIYRLDLEKMDAKPISFSYPKSVEVRDMIWRNDHLFVHGLVKESVKDYDKVLYLSLITCFIPLILHQPEGYPFVMELDYNKKTNNKTEYFMNNFGKTSTDYYSIEFRDSSDDVSLLCASWAKSGAKFYVQKIVDKKIQNAVEIKFPNKLAAAKGKIVTKDKNLDYISGIYGETKKINPLTAIEKTYLGMYFGIIENGKAKFLSTTKFTDFKKFNFYPTFIDKREEMNFFIHEIIERDDKILVLGEAYQENYKTYSRTIRYSDGTSSVNYYKSFDGFNWIGGFISCYNKEGKLLWENGLNLKEKDITYHFEAKVKFNETENGGFELSYDYPNKTQIKTIEPNGTGSKDQFVEATNQVVKIGKDTKKNINLGADEVLWYDDFKLAYQFTDERNKRIIGKKFDLFLTLKKIQVENEEE